MHNAFPWVGSLLFLTVLAAITYPLGLYLGQVLDPRGHTFLDRLVKPFERLTYRVLGIRADAEQDARQYGFSLLLFSVFTTVVTYLVLRLQHLLPLNPQGFGPVSPDLAFNTAVSFATNTNWQAYAGESTLSYFSQMVGLTLHQFASAGAGLAVAAALVRGIARQGTRTLGCFWVDLVRTTYYLLLPASFVFALFLVSQGVPQNTGPYVRIQCVDAAGAPEQNLPQGPIASQVAIKMLGTNGGGFLNANAAHPFENPTPLSNFLQVLSIFAIGSALTVHLGRATGNRAHGVSVWIAMMLLFVAGLAACGWAESRGVPSHLASGLVPGDGNMEGKEVRFGIAQSTLFATVTTAASCGAVNAMHDAFTALGGMVLLFNMQLGEVVVGGVGAGLYGMIVFVVISVFIAGLMVGRTPEYLGKKIEAFDVKMAMLALLVSSGTILVMTAWACVSPAGRAGPNETGPHAFTEILYAFTSATGNNGSAFAGLNANTPWYNTTLGIAMLVGRFLVIVPVLALAGSLGAKRPVAASAGTFPVSGPLFVILLIGTVVLVGALNFLPALALGPIVEHFLATQGTLF